MNGKNMLEGRTGPITQSLEAVKNLLAFVGRSADPLPTDVTLDNGRLVLVLSNKKDCYYVATAVACSCPSATMDPASIKENISLSRSPRAGPQKPIATGPQQDG